MTDIDIARLKREAKRRESEAQNTTPEYVRFLQTELDWLMLENKRLRLENHQLRARRGYE